jgi:predicted phosphodiesterase
MLIHYVSDLHLEGMQGRSDLTGVQPVDGSDVLVLAGDIVQLRQLSELERFVQPFVERKIPVLYVPGNHEYYRLSVPMPAQIRAHLQQIQGLHLLDDQSVVIDGVRFLGSTMWSPLRPVEDGIDVACDEVLQLHLNDFRMICCDDGERPMTPETMRAMHRQSWNWLRDALQVKHDGPTVVITHFVPTPAGIAPQFAGTNLNGYFVADCRELMNSDIDCWIVGHTHASFAFQDATSGVPLRCNPAGYFRHGAFENPDFDPVATVMVGRRQVLDELAEQAQELDMGY